MPPSRLPTARRRTAGLLLALLATPCAATAQAGPQSGAPGPLTAGTLRTAVAAAARMVRAASAVDRAWPGFWPAGQSFLVVFAEPGALLVGPAAAPVGYEPLPADALPAELRGRAHLHRGYPTGLGANAFQTRYALGRDTIPALPLMGSTPFDSLEFYYHEAFHGFQHGRGAFAAVASERYVKFGEPLVDPAHVASPRFAALGELERRLLDDALDLAPGDTLRALLREYLAVRHARVGAHADVWGAERRMERWEGTAQLAGCQAAAAALEERPARAVTCVRRVLRRPLKEYGDMPEADARLMRWRQYGTGAALALLLERLAVDWRPAVVGGAPLDELLARAVGFDAAAARTVAEAVVARHGLVPAGALP